ncbi:VOC family protein [Paracoccaceae bacterium Fryx2]|nr:VOC family protein [Paracoccaceae bacterium Fryx2]
MLAFDHLAVSALTLDEGVAAVEAALGVALAGGGQHPHMATHNRLLGLGDLYLEVIAADPAAPRPAWPRWFDLDAFAGQPRLTNWVARCDDLEAEVAASPAGVGVPVALARGDYRWRMAVPADGRLPFDGCFPALIEWQGPAHPARALPDAGVRLRRLEVAHPSADTLAALLGPRLDDARLVLLPGPEKAMRATFDTPHGVRVLE